MGTQQLSYSLNNRAGLPGQLYDADSSNFIDSKPCGAVVLQPGTAVELVNGLLRIAQGTGDPNSKVLWGVVVYTAAMEPGGYPVGQDVPVLRRGRIWANVAAGATFAQGAAVNYTHSSDGSNSQGAFTSVAVSAVAGSEISATKAVWFQDGGLVGASPSIACIELNLP